MAIPIRVRERMVSRIANYQGQRGPWAVRQWLDWYKCEPLSDEDFEWAKDQWRKEFPMNPKTRKKIAKWIKQGTRESNKEARKFAHGAFGAFLQQVCMNKQLAYALLKRPTAMVNTLLESWARYLASPQYHQETRSAPMVDQI